MEFQKAVKHKSKLRLALFGPSGAGKTFSALRIASGLGERIALIDTESGSASKYADRFNFDVAELSAPTIENYCKIITMANDYDVLIIDSLTHGWQELLQEIDKLAHGKYNGNTFRAWSEGTPKQRKMIKAMLASKCHIIATMRSKTEWTVSKDEKTGKMIPQRTGLAPEQGKGIEYEFDMLMEMSTNHIANIIKDRTGKFQDAMIDKPGEDFGKELYDWLNTGTEKPKIKGDPDKAASAINAAKSIVELSTIAHNLDLRSWEEGQKESLSDMIEIRKNELKEA